MDSGEHSNELRPAPGQPIRLAEKRSFLQLFPQLFLFPLLIVCVGVLVWLFFIANAQDNRSVEELISDIESGGPHARKQDLYALALKMRDLTSADGTPAYFDDSITRKLLEFLDRSKDDAKLREYLILALGRAGKPELTVPVMARIALGEGETPAGRIEAVQALGLSRSPQAVEALAAVIDRFSEPEHWELRWNALGALANVGGEVAPPHLRRGLEDPRREVSWSAACWLANFFGDGAGLDILRKLADWSYLDGIRGDRGRELLLTEKEKYMVMAINGLYRVEGPAILDLIREKSRDGRSPKVQNAALEILKKQSLEKS